MNYNITIFTKVNMFALFPWQLGLFTRNDDADNVEDDLDEDGDGGDGVEDDVDEDGDGNVENDLDEDGDGEGREQQKECATGRD